MQIQTQIQILSQDTPGKCTDAIQTAYQTYLCRLSALGENPIALRFCQESFVVNWDIWKNAQDTRIQ